MCKLGSVDGIPEPTDIQNLKRWVDKTASAPEHVAHTDPKCSGVYGHQPIINVASTPDTHIANNYATTAEYIDAIVDLNMQSPYEDTSQMYKIKESEVREMHRIRVTRYTCSYSKTASQLIGDMTWNKGRTYKYQGKSADLNDRDVY
jgi:hypothetical protein